MDRKSKGNMVKGARKYHKSTQQGDREGRGTIQKEVHKCSGQKCRSITHKRTEVQQRYSRSARSARSVRSTRSARSVRSAAEVP